MADALESGEPSAAGAFVAHGHAQEYGESKKDFTARRKSWLVAYGQANKRRAAASASVNDGIRAQPTPGAAAAAAAVTTKKPKRLGPVQQARVRKTPSWPRSWVNFSLL